MNRITFANRPRRTPPREPDARRGLRARLSPPPALALLLAALSTFAAAPAQAQTACPEISGDNGSGGEVVITTPCTITSTGKVRRTTGANNAIRLSGAGRLTIEKGGLVERTGDVTTSGHSVLRFDNRELTAVNRGTIRSTGNQVDGVEIIGSNTNDATFENWGTVETRGNDSQGITVNKFNNSGGERNTVVNRGLVKTMGHSSDGIQNGGSDTKITNFGRILTAGNASTGISSWGENVVITLEAGSLVRSTGTSRQRDGSDTASTGIWTSGANAKVNIKAGAKVEVTGASSTAVQLGWSGSTARVDASTLAIGGTVRATGTNSHGVRGNNDDATIDIKAGGLVEVTGDSSSALYFGFDGQTAIGGRFPTFTVTIGGRVRATGASSLAIKGHNSVEKITVLPTGRITGPIDLGGNPDTLVIHPGAHIHGRIHLGSGTDVLKFVRDGKEVGFGRGTVRLFDTPGTMSRTYTVYGVQGASGDTEPARIVAADVSAGPELRRALSAGAAGRAHAILARQALAARTGGAPGWAALFGGRSRPKSGGRVSSAGLVAGFDLPLQDGGWRLGFAAATWRGKGSGPSASASARGTAAGPYAAWTSASGITVDGSLLVGRDSHDTKRGVFDNERGALTALGKGRSSHVGASVGVGWRRAAGRGFELRPRLRASWSSFSHKGYAETGATKSNLRYGRWKERVVGLDAELGVARPFAGGAGEVEFRAIAGQRRTSGNPGPVSLEDVATAKADVAAASGRASRFGAGVAVRWALGPSTGLEADVEFAGKGSAAGSVAIGFAF